MAGSQPLRRSVNNRVIAGVVGGVAEHFGLDATLLRVVYVLASVPSGVFPGILVYLIGWLIIPQREY